MRLIYGVKTIGAKLKQNFPEPANEMRRGLETMLGTPRRSRDRHARQPGRSLPRCFLTTRPRRHKILVSPPKKDVEFKDKMEFSASKNGIRGRFFASWQTIMPPQHPFFQ
jgi:hypothetical protein